MNEEFKQKIRDIIYYADWKKKMRNDGYEEQWIENEDMIIKAIVEEAITNMWDWLDTLPENQKTPMAKAIVRNYITGYLHDLRENKIQSCKEKVNEQ